MPGPDSAAAASPTAGRSGPGAWRVAVDLLVLAAIEGVWTWPLVARLSAGIPGAPGDNLSFLWNFWWMRKALATPGLHVFSTDYLFHPLSVDLALNTNTALNAWIGATLLAPFSIVTALNVTILAGLVLAAFGAYGLAVEVTGSRAGALAAGVLFGTSPYLAAHLAGHFNLTAAWVLPWFALAFVRAIGRGSRAAAAGAGLCLIATAYTDYYYLVFAAAFALLYLVASWQAVGVRVEPRAPTRATMRSGRLLAILLAIVLAAIAVVAVTGGGVWRVGRLAISMQQTFNLREIAWLLAVAWLLTRWRVRIRVALPPPGVLRRDLAACAIVAAIALAGLVPLAAHAWTIWRHGDYATQAYSWKSAPSGIDLVSLVAGNPSHPLYGRLVRHLYRRLGLDRVEGVGWLGLVPMVLAWIGWRRWSGRGAASRWGLVFVAFLIWALGPFLRVGGVNTGLVLPETLLRFVPIAANARIPGRAMVMVYLALAVLVAMGVASLRGWWRRPPAAALLAAIVFFGYLQLPLTIYQPDRPAIYTRLADLPEHGALLELPFGLADGFGARGRFDRRALYYQTLHERPIAGGFIARLSPRVLDAYARLPVLGPLWKLSAGAPVAPADLPAGRAALDALAREGFAFVVLDRAEAPPALVRYVDTLPLTPIMKDGEQELYGIAPATGNGR
ncbi:MAG: hypothetical protein KGN76_14650 [Acidobacteriota bacterium]|nr:hypothetical protein [Acidobacteriota bacterium]